MRPFKFELYFVIFLDKKIITYRVNETTDLSSLKLHLPILFPSDLIKMKV